MVCTVSRVMVSCRARTLIVLVVVRVMIWTVVRSIAVAVSLVAVVSAVGCRTAGGKCKYKDTNESQHRKKFDVLFHSETSFKFCIFIIYGFYINVKYQYFIRLVSVSCLFFMLLNFMHSV